MIRMALPAFPRLWGKDQPLATLASSVPPRCDRSPASTRVLSADGEFCSVAFQMLSAFSLFDLLVR